MPESYQELLAWQRAMDLVEAVYESTRTFPGDEVYGLTAQIRRAAVSIPSNIAEGKGRFSKADLLHFLVQARGSLYELQTQLLIAQRLKYLDKEHGAALLDSAAETARLLNGLIRKFRT